MTGSLQISLPNPVYPSPRLVLEAPRPRYVSRTLGHPPRSSPLAGPAIAVSRSSVSDSAKAPEAKDNAEKTRRGATPSRISTLHPSPPSSLRSLSMSRTPSPSRSTSDFSHKSSASSATSHSISSSPPLSPTTSSPHKKVQPEPSLRTRVSGSASDPTRNWLTRTAPPPFSRSLVKGVVMPVKATSGRRPQTAPAAPSARSHVDGGLSSGTSSLKGQLHRRHSQHGSMASLYNSADSGHADGGLSFPPSSLRGQVLRRPSQRGSMTSFYNSAESGHADSGFLPPSSMRGQVHRRHSQHGSMTSFYNSAESGHAGMLSGLDPVTVRKQRRTRSLRTMSVRSTLGEVREEQEREGEDDSEGDGESDKTWTEARYVKDKLVFPVLAMKAENVEVSNTPREGEHVAGWIKRRWMNSLKLVKEQFGKVPARNGP